MYGSRRCVSTSVLELAEVSDNNQAPSHGHQQNIRAFLGGLFGQLCTGQGHLSQTGLLQKPWLVATAARLIGDYALWFSTLGGSEVPLEGALRLLLAALQMPQVQFLQSTLLSEALLLRFHPPMCEACVLAHQCKASCANLSVR